MSTAEHRIQVLYEISLSVGPGEGLRETARNALSTYLQKLNCAEGAVVERRSTGDDEVQYRTVSMIPSQAAVSDGFRAALARLPSEADDDASFRESMPLEGHPVESAWYYVMDLPGFGVLLLLTRGRRLDSETVAALGPLNEKLATACENERYKARVREERDRFETVFDTIEEPLASVAIEDGNLVVKRVNSAFEATFGYDESRARGLSLSAVVGPPPSDGEEIPVDEIAADSNASVTAELRRQTTHGLGEFRFRSAPITLQNGENEHLVLFVDITEEATRQRTLEQMYGVTKALSRILRHNIRNDLIVIQARANTLLNETEGDLADDAAKILEKSEELASTAEKAREMREVVAGHEAGSPVTLQEAVRDVVSDVRTDYPAATITTDLPTSERITVPTPLTIALRNLVENGVEHHDPDSGGNGHPDDGEGSVPSVEITSTVDSDELTIAVSDNGPGIPDAEVAMIGRVGETDLEHGSGAGLWIVDRIVDYCDATLEFDTSEDGTTAVLTLDGVYEAAD
ncbi:hypothetical protein BRC64_11535 [Halobacteriales archaeon QH_10_67_22]|nr:MAG: hypothetical protein BRC64_11535 [Halobacteriales archaeon QH_10_67_22]